jgi:hypothetical protein
VPTSAQAWRLSVVGPALGVIDEEEIDGLVGEQRQRVLQEHDVHVRHLHIARDIFFSPFHTYQYKVGKVLGSTLTFC